MLALIFLGACGDGNPNEEGTSNQSNAEVNAAESKTADDKGLGKFTNVELTHPLDLKMIDAGKLIYDVKCGSCHRLSKEKLVGPGWKGVTSRRKPEWIMNFATNAEEMLTKDGALKSSEIKGRHDACVVPRAVPIVEAMAAMVILDFYLRNKSVHL